MVIGASGVVDIESQREKKGNLPSFSSLRCSTQEVVEGRVIDHKGESRKEKWERREVRRGGTETELRNPLLGHYFSKMTKSKQKRMN